MKLPVKKQITFIARSMLWSALFYAAMMLVFNWDEVSNKYHGRTAVTVVSSVISVPQPQAPVINIANGVSVISSALSAIMHLVK